MAIRRCAFVATLLPAFAFASNATNATNVSATTPVAATWSASTAAATLVAKQAFVVQNILTAASTAAGTKLTGMVITGLTCNASGPAATGTISFSLTDATAALADSQFPRWIAKGIASTMGADPSQVDVWMKAARRLTTDGAGRRLTTAATGTFNVYNPNRARNIGLGIGLGVVAPAVGLGVGLGLGLEKPTTAPAPVTPIATLPPIPATTVPVLPMATTIAPEESGSSMPIWLGVLLALAVLACIGAGVAMMMKGGKKKKAPRKKASPVPQEPMPVVEEVMPMLAPAPVYQSVQTFQPPVPAPVFTSYAAPQYAMAPQYAAPQYAAPAVQSMSRRF